MRSSENIIAFPRAQGDNTHYTLAQLSELTGYHPVYLRRLCLEGKIDGIKVELGRGPGFWVATEEAVQKYQEQKDNRGRPVRNTSSR